MMDKTTKYMHQFEDATNTMFGIELYTNLLDTVCDIRSKLTMHCGPFAANALMVRDDGAGNIAPLYTKDGIQIVRSISYGSMFQSQIKSLIANLGTRVDTKAHDGTTTAMLLTCDMLIYFLTELVNLAKDERVSENELKRRIKEFETRFIKFCDDLIGEFNDKFVYTLDDLIEMFGSRDEAIDFICYHQAMLSGKGDKHLAKCVQAVFKSIPTELVDVFKFNNAGVENKENFALREAEYDYESIVFAANRRHFNAHLNQEFHGDDCDVIVIYSAIDGEFVYDELIRHLKETEKDTVIITKDTSSNFISFIDNYKEFKAKILPVVLTKDMHLSDVDIQLSHLAAMAGKGLAHEYEDLKDAIIPNVKVRLYSCYIKLDNLYKKDEDSRIHPFYTDPEKNEYFTRFKNDLFRLIERRRQDIKTTTQNEINALSDLYFSLIANRCPQILVGGTATDHAANISVITDVMGAIASGLDGGIVIDSNMKMLYILDKINNGLFEDSNPLKATLSEVYDDVDRVYNELVSRVKEDDLTQFEKLYYNTATNEYGDIGNLNEDSLVVVQPANMYREIIRRIKEAVPKVIGTYQVVIPGTINIKQS